MLTVEQIRSKARKIRDMGAATIAAHELDAIADEIERLRDALREIGDHAESVALNHEDFRVHCMRFVGHTLSGKGGE